MEGIHRKSYSDAVIEGVRKRARVFVGDSIVRKTDRDLNNGVDVEVCMSGAKIEAITERVENIVGSGKGGLKVRWFNQCATVPAPKPLNGTYWSGVSTASFHFLLLASLEVSLSPPYTGVSHIN